jgi:ATP-dependent DNA helicase RecG
MDGRLAQYLSQGEDIGLEFKRCGNQTGADVFETICSFANRQGGSLLLGVLDDGEVEGVPEPSALPIERNLVNVTCNPKLFNVAPAIECERIPCGGGRVVIRV